MFKLATLLVKMVAKPVASGIKSRAKRHPRLSTISEKIGNFWYIFTQTAQLRLKGHKVKKIKPLSGEEALISGADFLGESFVYSVSASIVIVEVWRQDEKSKRMEAQKKRRQRDKEAKRTAEFDQLESRIRTMTDEQIQLRKDFNALLEYKAGISKNGAPTLDLERPAAADTAAENSTTVSNRGVVWPWSWFSGAVSTTVPDAQQERKA